ncbi:DUF262 domain-containing protein [Nocardioides pantholopis]|uniref:DUF262 domain-containing protein n=1 Tax=Nocardioides pantholopis TaxID=2483798 RepID=UPI000F073E84|nr:DUF262 domain-containing protein [Nocardioides pantholopis]
MSTEPKLWNLSTLKSARYDASGNVEVDPNNPVVFSIPQFQRSLVWPEKKQRDLIASILKGFPMGALLLVEHRQKKQVTLPNGSTVDATVYGIIDGLQRTNAIVSHLRQSLAFATEEAVESVEFDAFHADLNAEAGGGIDADALMSAVVGWMSETKVPEPVSGFDFDTLLDSVAAGLEIKISAQSKKTLKQAASALIQYIGKRVDISNYQIPVLVYKGSPANLPDIFEKINTAGTILSKYEVFAAAWVSTQVTVKDTDVQAAIARRYKVLEDEGFDVDNGGGQVYSLFDYLHGLSQVLGERYPLLFSAADAKRNNLSGAFPLATLMLGRTLDKMNELHTFFPVDNSGHLEVDAFEKAVLESAKFVSKCLEPHLAFKFVSDTEAPAHSELQIVSMIAAVAANLFDHKKKFSDRGSEPVRTALKKKFQEALPQHYIYDIIRQYWRGSLYTYAAERVWNGAAPSKVYATPVDANSFDAAIKTLETEQAAKVSHRRSNVTSFDRVFLKFVYSKKVSVADQAAHKFDVEHWLPIKRLQEITKNSDPWPMGMMGNLGVLTVGSNRRKKDETVSEYLGRSTRKPTPAEHALIKKMMFVPVADISIPKGTDGKDKMTRAQYDSIVRKNWRAMCKDLKKHIGL